MLMLNIIYQLKYVLVAVIFYNNARTKTVFIFGVYSHLLASASK